MKPKTYNFKLTLAILLAMLVGINEQHLQAQDIILRADSSLVELADRDASTAIYGISKTPSRVKAETPATGIDLPETLTLAVGRNKDIRATMLPEGASDHEIEWSSSNPDVATVVSKMTLPSYSYEYARTRGLINTKSPGTCIITATSKDNPDLSDQCQVTVEDGLVAVGSIIEFDDGDKGVLYHIDPVTRAGWVASFWDAYYGGYNLRWYTGESETATADLNYEKSNGEGWENELPTNGYYNTQFIRSKGGVDVYPPFNAIDFNKGWYIPAIGQLYNLLKYDVRLEIFYDCKQNGAAPIISNTPYWSSTPRNATEAWAVQCDTPGMLRSIAKKERTHVRPVRDVALATGVSLNKSNLTLSIDEEYTLVASMIPANAYDNKIRWYSSNEAVATVDNNGKLTAHTPGTATITVESVNGYYYTATCEVTVEPNYLLYINGVKVSDSNKNDLSAISGVTGTATYNHDTKTLHLENATINATGTNGGIFSKIEGLKIELVGNNTINNKGHASLQFDGKSGTIQGDGTLTLNNEANFYALFASSGASLTIKDCTVNAESGNRGISGTDTGTLTVDNAKISATGNGGSIRGFKEMNFIDCFILQPAYGTLAYNTTQMAVCSADGTIVKDQVNIMRGTAYDIRICGVQITSINKDNLHAIEDVNSGTITYNPAENTLTLTGAVINVSGNGNAILSKFEGLKIELIGNNIINNNGYSSLQFDGNSATILGNGTLTATNLANDYAIHTCSGASLTIKDCTVNANGGNRGISGTGTETLTVDNAKISATGTNGGSIRGFMEMNFTDCFILQPTYGNLVYNTTQMAVCNTDGTIVKDQVNINRGTAYDIRVCGVQVTSVNKDILNTIQGVNSGTITYNPADNTLTLTDAVINVSGSGTAILSKVNALNIVLVGNNIINNNGHSSIQFEHVSGIIRGDGTLTVTNQANDFAIYVSGGASLDIRDCTINAKGGRRGITGNGSSTLTINNAVVTAEGQGDGSIYGFRTLNLFNNFISQAVNEILEFNPDKKAICKADGTIVKNQVKIIRGTAYDVRICGVLVTSLNIDNLSDISGVTAGTINYNPTANTLSLTDVQMATTGNTCCILSRINKMIIEVNGVNTLSANGWSPIAYENNNSGTIQGSGTLNLSNAHTNEMAIFMRNGWLTIKDCNLNASGGKNAIFGNSGEGVLTIDNAIVNASLNTNGTKEGTIKGFKNIYFKNCVIVQPTDASFNATQKAICHTDGTIVKEKIETVRGVDLTICGTKIKPADMGNIAAVDYDKGTVSGNISYDPITRTLTLENASIATTDYYTNGVVSSVDGLKIILIGNNTITAHVTGIQFSESATIEGNGTLTVNALDGICLWDYTYISLAVKGCTVNLTGTNKGIFPALTRANLIVDNATVSIRGKSVASMKDMDLTLTNSLITNPNEVKYDAVDGAFKDNDGNFIKSEVRIVPGTTYALSICDVPVTSLSKDNLAAVDYQNGTVSGNISYSPDTQTLTLDGAVINNNKYGNKGVIKTDIDNLKIVLIGNNSLTNNSGTGIMCNATATIEGNGTLNINSPVGMYFKNLLTIKNSTVNINSSLAGIHSYDYSDTDELTIDNATVSVTGTQNGSFYNVNDLNLMGCEIVSPANAAFDATQKAACDALGNIIKTEINIWSSNLPTFTSTTPENWKTASKWSTGAVPDALQRVFINGDAVISEDLNVAAFAIKPGKSITVNAGKKLTAGKSFNNGTIHLLSDAANGTATLVGDVAGHADIQQAAVNYRTYYLSSPVSGTISTSPNMGNYITFTESSNQWTSPAPFAGITPTAGKGYGVQVGAGVAVSERGTATTLSFEGTLNNGEVKIPITSGNKQFNFLGNPYPSFLNTVKVVEDPNIISSLWFYSKLADNTPYQFTAYNVPTGISIPDAGHDYGYIPPMQGFWVKANANVDYTFNNEMRVHKPAGSPAIFRAPQSEEKQLLRLQLSNGTIKDETAVLFSVEATNDWNTPKMTSQKLCIYTLKDGENLALNSSRAIEHDVEIPVGVKAESGVYTFSASKLENFGAERVFLLDKVANTVTNLSNNDIHTVNFKEAYEGTDRFALVVPHSGVITGWDGATQTEFYAYTKDKRITVSSDARSGTIYVYNSVGQQVAATPISSNLTTVSAVLQEGVYVVKLNNQTAKVVVR